MKRIILIITITAFFAGCNKFGDTNIAPNQLTVASTKALLTNSMQAMSALSLGGAATARLGSLYVQHLAEGPYPGPSLYSDRNLAFSAWYTGPLVDLKTIITYNNDGRPEAVGNGAKENQIAVARILTAHYFLLMTDRWGDIPYSEALKGQESFAPVYDKQQDIYTALFKELTEANAQINLAGAPLLGDVMLGGNMAAWKRFANTLRMTMALRLSKADAAKGKTEYAAALSAGVISNNSEAISYKFISGDPFNSNPWFNNYNVDNRNDYAISKTLTDYMESKADPRLKVYGENLAGGVVTGLTYGRNAAINIPGAYSRIGERFKAQGAQLYLFTYPQVLFMQAEAAKLGYAAGGDAEAEAKYLAAIKASWELYGVFNQAAYDTYVALPAVAYTSANGHQKIMTEKWVHQYLNSWETWNDWRRTGFPTLTPAVDAIDARGIPLRLGYPTNEATLNGENYKAAVAALGAKDDNYAKMWWLK